jgi:sulfur carrier protein ThiS
MRVRVRLHGILRKFLPAGAEGDVAVVELPETARAADAIARLGIPGDHAAMLVSGDEYLERDSPLREGQELNVFPPLAGG